MSKKVEATLTCPECGKLFPYTLYRSIWGEHPENRQLVMSDKITHATCPKCGGVSQIPFSLLYVDIKQKFAVWWEPEYDPQIDVDALAYAKMFGERNFYATAPRISDWNEFKNCIIKFEQRQNVSGAKNTTSNTKNGKTDSSYDFDSNSKKELPHHHAGVDASMINMPTNSQEVEVGIGKMIKTFEQWISEGKITEEETLEMIQNSNSHENMQKLDSLLRKDQEEKLPFLMDSLEYRSTLIRNGLIRDSNRFIVNIFRSAKNALTKKTNNIHKKDCWSNGKMEFSDFLCKEINRAISHRRSNVSPSHALIQTAYKSSSYRYYSSDRFPKIDLIYESIISILTTTYFIEKHLSIGNNPLLLTHCIGQAVETLGQLIHHACNVFCVNNDNAILAEIYQSHEYDSVAFHGKDISKSPGLLTNKEIYLLGMTFYGCNEYEEAVRWFRLASDRGISHAQLMLGTCYSKGKGVEKNEEKAVEQFRKAAEQGDAEAQILLGKCHDTGRGICKDYKKAIFWYHKAAGQGNADAQFFLAHCLLHPNGDAAFGKKM